MGLTARPDLAALRALVGEAPLTRFAPSPTGYLHLGHVAHAIYVWGISAALGGRVLLRVEDHDRIRSRRGYEAALLEDLAWLGFEPDDGRQPLLRQSDRPQVYEEALEQLRRNGLVYACRCSRKDIGGDRYDGRCRRRDLKLGPGVGIRVRLGPGQEVFDDGLMGTLTQSPAEQCGDLLARDRDGHWTYQFAVTVDDMQQGVTLVIRGADLVSSTGRQLALARLLGREKPPVFLHHPLIHDSQGAKLSKSAGDTGVRELRAGGLTAAQVIAMAAARAGLIERAEPVEASDVPLLFAARPATERS